MKLALFLVLVGWYAAAKKLQSNGTKAEWQVRCLNCKSVRPANRSDVIRNARSGMKSYSLAECKSCNRMSGMAIEPLAAEDSTIAI